MANTTFLNNIDGEKVKELLNSTDINSTYFARIVDDVVKSYSSDLENLMSTIEQSVFQNTIVDDISLESYALRLTNMLYFIGERLETVGIKADIARAARQEIYNKTYLENDVEKEINGKKVKPTKDANMAVAEEESKYESVVSSIYERTYKIIKFKIDAAQEMVNTLRKIITKHIQDANMAFQKASIRTVENNEIEI